MSVFDESSLSDQKRILSGLFFGSFLPLLCPSCPQWFSPSYLSCLTSVLVSLLAGLMFCISWMMVSFQSIIGEKSSFWSVLHVYTSPCCQSLTSFLNIQPQYNILPYITVMVHSDSEWRIFPSAVVNFSTPDV